ncbi:MAG: sigma 54-interacting transcriptional regulator [Terrimicrobiaceae bacterium]
MVEGTASETGVEFFKALVKNLATVMDTAGAWVTEYLPENRHLRPLAFWLNGRYFDAYAQPIDNTPCEVVLTERRLVHYPDRILDFFPTDPDLIEVGAVSYLGVPLFDTEGGIMGHLAVVDTKPLPKEPRLLSLFEIFASRAAAECRRLRAEQAVRMREKQLSAILDGAMDAVVVLDDEGCIVRVNPAAIQLFGCTEKDLLGEAFREFLPEESARLFGTLAKELDGQAAKNRHRWIPQSFPVLRWDRKPFPSEATLSQFTNGGKTFHVVILRNVDERMAAERQIELLLAEAEYLRDSSREDAGLGSMIGRSRVMKELFESLNRVAATDTTVLITGETGTGKELIARSIHMASPRKDKPLVRVNCAAIPGTLMESEFFGHERGAFTGATAKREGRFALADGGTIFLDEVGELPLELQAKLLRVLQEGEFEPLGSTRTHKVDVRVIAATNCDLFAMVSEGKFREDLLYRLNVFPLEAPPLRERGKDIRILASAFVDRFSRQMGRRIEPLQEDDLRIIEDYPWPGNVRELQNVIERAIILANGGRVNLQRALPALAGPNPPPATQSETARILTAEEFAALERANLERALKQCHGKVAGANGAAQLLGLPPSTVSSRLRALGISKSLPGSLP